MIGDSARLAAVLRATELAQRHDARLDGLTRAARTALGVRFAFLSLVGAEVETLCAATVAHGPPLPTVLPTAASICQLVVRTGAPLVVPDLAEHAELSLLVEVRELGMRAYAGIPVRSRDGQLLGGFCVADDLPRVWTQRDLDLLGDLADAAARQLALQDEVDDALLERQAERARADSQAVLYRIATAAARSADPTSAMRTIAHEVVRLVDAVAAFIVRFEGDVSTEVVASAGAAATTGQIGLTWWRLAVQEPGPDGPDLADWPCAAVPIMLDRELWGAVVIVLGSTTVEERLSQFEEVAELLGLVTTSAQTRLRLEQMAYTDALTGIGNRRALEQRCAPGRRRRGPAATTVFALLDIDGFKAVNDAEGHDRGDQVLRALVSRLSTLVRSDDLIARLGGDEFALVLSTASPDEASAVLERVRDAVRAAPLAGHDVTISLGACVVQGDLDLPALYARADAALYRAKRAGRDRWELDPLA